jgi:hypothetical protein
MAILAQSLPGHGLTLIKSNSWSEITWPHAGQGYARPGELVSMDSPLEGPGFELSVPRKRDQFLKFAYQMAARKAYAQQTSAITATTGSSIPRDL